MSCLGSFRTTEPQSTCQSSEVTKTDEALMGEMFKITRNPVMDMDFKLPPPERIPYKNKIQKRGGGRGCKFQAPNSINKWDTKYRRNGHRRF